MRPSPPIDIIFETHSTTEDNEVGFGHLAARWGLEHRVRGVALEDLVVAEFAWQEGWEYRLG